MKIYIMNDIEGVSGIYHKEQVVQNGSRYQEGRRLMTREANICADALKEAGVDTVYYHDCHGMGSNVFWDELSPSIDKVIIGSNANIQNRFAECVKECDGVILLGYHAMAGTPGAILEHTFSSMEWQNLWINGEKSGEAKMDAAILGDWDIPVIMLSGDDKLEKEVREFLPDVPVAVVKEGLSCMSGILLSPEKAKEELRQKTFEAIKNIANAKPYKISAPVEMKVELVERNEVPHIYKKPYMTVHDGRTYSVTADSAVEALYKLL